MHTLRIAAVATVLALCGAAGTAMADNFAQVPVVAAAPSPTPYWQRGGMSSDRNLRRVYRGVERVIDNLQRDNKDYNGHRVAAIRDLTQAREALRDALQYDKSKEPSPRPYTMSAPVSGQTSTRNPSDKNIGRMIRVLERGIDMLQHDQHDYNGNRVKAINYMQQGRDELKAALLADQGH